MNVDFKEYKAAFLEQNDIKHFGILGMKWGVRRYQNPDGTLTPAGKRRYDRLEDASDFNFRMSIGSSPRKAKKYLDKSMALTEKAKKYGTETPEERAEKQRAKERWESIPKKDRDRLEKMGNRFKDDKTKAKFKRAMQEDIYSLSFLEAVQNASFYNYSEGKDGKKQVRMLEEYAKYLQDPEKYWNNRSSLEED